MCACWPGCHHQPPQHRLPGASVWDRQHKKSGSVLKARDSSHSAGRYSGIQRVFQHPLLPAHEEAWCVLNDVGSQSVTNHFSPSSLALQKLQRNHDVVTAQVGERSK